jgi:hypothetical protein
LQELRVELLKYLWEKIYMDAKSMNLLFSNEKNVHLRNYSTVGDLRGLICSKQLYFKKKGYFKDELPGFLQTMSQISLEFRGKTVEFSLGSQLSFLS